MTGKDELIAAIKKAVLDGDEAGARRLAQETLEAGIPPLEAIDKGFVPGIRQAGDLWEEGEFFLPELVTAAQAMKSHRSILQGKDIIV